MSGNAVINYLRTNDPNILNALKRVVSNYKTSKRRRNWIARTRGRVVDAPFVAGRAVRGAAARGVAAADFLSQNRMRRRANMVNQQHRNRIERARVAVNARKANLQSNSRATRLRALLRLGGKYW